ncbi:hypothetical protein EMCRGX_G006648 [Ephydatia muelleri]
MKRISKRRTEAPVCYSYRADPEKNVTSYATGTTLILNRSDLLKGSDHIKTTSSMSEESEQVAEMDTSEISVFDTDVIDAQAVTITNCGIAGNIVQAALQFGLAFVPNSGIVGVSVNCALRVGSYVCTNVVVSVRGVQYTSVRACVAPTAVSSLQKFKNMYSTALIVDLIKCNSVFSVFNHMDHLLKLHKELNQDIEIQYQNLLKSVLQTFDDNKKRAIQVWKIVDMPLIVEGAV